MRVERLAIEDFRNYRATAVEFVPGVNLIVGRNAQGKTNLLEAVYCLSGLGSPRSPDASVVRDGAERAFVHGAVRRGHRAIELDLELKPGRGTRALINKTPAPSVRALTEVFVAVFFGPDELSLIKGSPEGRRRFVDDLVVKIRPSRFALRREWERVLKQRNALLRSWPRGEGEAAAAETLSVWNDAFVRAAGALTAARLDALRALLPYARKRYEAIAGGGRLDLRYASEWLDAPSLDGAQTDEDTLRSTLGDVLTEIRSREIERGTSLAGPQRDDVWVGITSPDSVESLDARSYASQGDQRTAALALKLGEFDLLADALDDPPVVLLDDVFSELDAARRQWLSEAVRDLGQVIVTSAEPGADAIARADRVVEVAGGRLRIRE